MITLKIYLVKTQDYYSLTLIAEECEFAANFAATMSRSEQIYVLLNRKSSIHSINRIQNKDYETGTYEIKEISLS